MVHDDEDLRPLKGVVLCCTSLRQDVRTSIIEAASPMGAIHKADLTSDVTHLIVGRIATPKYNFVARERPDIHVLHPNFIEAVRSAWLEGGDVDVRKLEAEHRLPTFSDLHICLTGFNDLDLRNQISETVAANGATYHGDLSRGITHLIAAAPEGAKYNAARQWGTNIVSLAWFKDSLRRGMALDEKCYDPTLPEEQQGKGALKEVLQPRVNPAKRVREVDQNELDEAAGKRKLRRTVSSRLDGHSQEMWQDISLHRGDSRVKARNQWQDDDDDDHDHDPEATHKRQSLDNATPNNVPTHSDERQPQERHGKLDNNPQQALFSGCYILLQGFDGNKASKLRQFLEPNGAVVVASMADFDSVNAREDLRGQYLLVPHAVSNARPNLPNVPAGTIVATEWWVERCIHAKHLFDPNEDPLSRPLWDVRVRDFSSVGVATTGFNGVDVRQMAEAVKLMGGRYEETLCPAVSVLISQSREIKKEKAYYAKKHNIPVVTADWLWACSRMEQMVSVSDFLIKLPGLDAARVSDGAPSTNASGQSTATLQVPQGSHQRPKRLSSSRRMQATPKLALQAFKPSAQTAQPRLPPFVHEDDDASPAIDEDMTKQEPPRANKEDSRTTPLRELSPNLSPRKMGNIDELIKNDELSDKPDTGGPDSATQTHSPRQTSLSGLESNPADAPAPSRKPNELAADLAALLNRRSTSRPNSAQPETKRKRRPLGRNLSGNSNASTAGPAAGTAEIAYQPIDDLGPLIEQTNAPAPPSTQLGYDTPDADAQRLRLERKMGLNMSVETEMSSSNSRRIASLGVVKDSDVTIAAAAATGRSRLRGRHRGNK